MKAHFAHIIPTFICYGIFSETPFCKTNAGTDKGLPKKFSDNDYAEAAWWKSRMETDYRKCWKPKGQLYLKVLRRDMENQRVVDEIAFYVTSCILEDRGRPILLCHLTKGNDQINIRDCMKKHHSYAWTLFQMFTSKIPLMTLQENLEISNSDLDSIQKLLRNDVNFAVKDIKNVPSNPIFHNMKKEMLNCIEENRAKLEDYEIFLAYLYDSVTIYISDSLKGLFTMEWF